MADATNAIEAIVAIEPFGVVWKAIETSRCKKVEHDLPHWHHE